jgi:hypothetical protein
MGINVIGRAFLVAVAFIAPSVSGAQDFAYDTAKTNVVWAWEQYNVCSSKKECAAYTAQKALEGKVYLISRLHLSAHDMIVRAKAARILGYNDVAIEFVRSTQLHNPEALSFIDRHPSQILRALDTEIHLEKNRGKQWAKEYLRSVNIPIP